jgi:uracil-DNA glycosylase family 4
MQTEHDAQVLAALLDWYREMGADTAVTDIPTNWLERGDAAPGHTFRLPEATPVAGARADARAPEIKARPAPTASPSVNTAETRGPAASRVAPQMPAATPRFEARPPFSATPPDAAEIAARTAAAKAQSLEQLEAALRTFDGCGLKATAKNLCFYRGAERARLMIVGEAPGREEDLEGKPFVGRAGQLLDKMLAALSLTEADVHITNVVYWRPPGNRTPTPQESQVCRPFLERQIELVEPEIVLLLGGAAAKQVLDVAEGIMRIRGKWREITSGKRAIKTMATLHPAYLLRTPAAKRHVWRDLLAVEAALAAKN